MARGVPVSHLLLRERRSEVLEKELEAIETLP
jgi:hypothetical protein